MRATFMFLCIKFSPTNITDAILNPTAADSDGSKDKDVCPFQ